jgi:hypothetical protein
VKETLRFLRSRGQLTRATCVCVCVAHAGTPYINHPLGVAWCLSEEGGVKDVETLQAAMLHEYGHTIPSFRRIPRLTQLLSLSCVRDGVRVVVCVQHCGGH